MQAETFRSASTAYATAPITTAKTQTILMTLIEVKQAAACVAGLKL
jgi:hypothetical protein